jgi:periplasmic protein TonB
MLFRRALFLVCLSWLAVMTNVAAQEAKSVARSHPEASQEQQDSKASSDPAGPAGNSGPVHVTPHQLIGGGLVHKVAPEYPKQAKKNGVEGVVKLQVLVGTDGRIHDVKPVSGPEELVHPAIKAVKQWRYNPFFRDGEPIEVSTDISVTFKLDQQSGRVQP